MSYPKSIVVHVRTCEELGFYLALGSFSGKEREEAIRNAHMIAAASELLALAKRYASECGECEGSGHAPHYADRSTPEGRAEPMFVDCKDCADIRAVIAKAQS
jgi:hypothetical protein